MPQREQTHIKGNVLHAIEEENDAQQKQQVVITGDHVLGPEIDKRDQIYACYFLNIPFVTLGDGVGQNVGAHPEESKACDDLEQAVSAWSSASTGAPVR